MTPSALNRGVDLEARLSRARRLLSEVTPMARLREAVHNPLSP